MPRHPRRDFAVRAKGEKVRAMEIGYSREAQVEHQRENIWIAQKLNMGNPRGLSSNLSVYAKANSKGKFKKKLHDLHFDV